MKSSTTRIATRLRMAVPRLARLLGAPLLIAAFLAGSPSDGSAAAPVPIGYSDCTLVRPSTGGSFGHAQEWFAGRLTTAAPTTDIYFTDVTGDGKADHIDVSSTGITVHRSSGEGFRAAEYWSNWPYRGDHGTYFADVTGDSRADAIVVNRGSVVVRRSTGTGFAGNETWWPHRYHGDRTDFADVDGDGKADAVTFQNGTITVRRSTGAAFAGVLQQISPDLGISVWRGVPWGTGFDTAATHFADVDGDGRADAVTLDNSAATATVRRSTGAAFAGSVTWKTTWLSGVRLADVTGDGRADAIGDGKADAFGGSGLRVRPSTGERFDQPATWSSAVAVHRFADVTGDGKADAIEFPQAYFDWNTGRYSPCGR